MQVTDRVQASLLTAISERAHNVASKVEFWAQFEELEGLVKTHSGQSSKPFLRSPGSKQQQIIY